MKYIVEIESNSEAVLKLFEKFTAELFQQNLLYAKRIKIEVDEEVTEYDNVKTYNQEDDCPF